jgi:hypothetical protein
MMPTKKLGHARPQAYHTYKSFQTQQNNTHQKNNLFTSRSSVVSYHMRHTTLNLEPNKQHTQFQIQTNSYARLPLTTTERGNQSNFRFTSPQSRRREGKKKRQITALRLGVSQKVQTLAQRGRQQAHLNQGMVQYPPPSNQRKT